ncbi:uncharacterized protein LOC142330523 [Lycorma delicatula]|uniref:uncharacterized protein LOC142330523 n=1 Tax=Lycorma delicatula TaxID=130591 RepID=UPI003F51559B
MKGKMFDLISLFLLLNLLFSNILRRTGFAESLPASENHIIKQKRLLLQFSRFGQTQDLQQIYDLAYDQQSNAPTTLQPNSQLWLRYFFDTFTDLILRGLYKNFSSKWTKGKVIRIKNYIIRKLRPFVMRAVRRVLGRRRKRRNMGV